jgi:SAM-dependent methyltransferase
LDNLRRCHIKGLVLDAGCGHLISSITEVPENVKAVCMDLSRQNVLNSKKLCKGNGRENIVYLRASVTDLPFKDGTFDMVVSQDVIEHVPDNKALFREALRVLNGKGVFVGSTSNLLNPFFLFDSLACRALANQLARRFAGQDHYDRHSRLSFVSFVSSLFVTGFDEVGVVGVGYPLVDAIGHNYTNKKIGMFALLWIAFDKLTNFLRLFFLKEMIVFIAKKL